MNDVALQLTAVIQAVCPIYGVWVGNPSDKTTWGIWFQPSATSTQKTAANSALSSFTAN